MTTHVEYRCVCDRCGKTMGIDTAVKSQSRWVAKGTFKYYDYTYEFCEECYAAFKEFLEVGKR